MKFSQLEREIGLDRAVALCRERLLDGSLNLKFDQWLDILRRGDPDSEIRAQALNEMCSLVTNPGQWFIIFDQAPQGSIFRSVALDIIRQAFNKLPTFEKVKTAWEKWRGSLRQQSGELQAVLMERLLEEATDFEHGYWIYETAAEIPDIQTFQARALELMIKTAQDFDQLWILITGCLPERSEDYQQVLRRMFELASSCGESLVVWKMSSGALRQKALNQVLGRAKTFAEWLEVVRKWKPADGKIHKVVHLKLNRLARTFDQCVSVAQLYGNSPLPPKLWQKLIRLAKTPLQKLQLLSIAKEHGFRPPWTEKNVADSITSG